MIHESKNIDTSDLIKLKISVHWRTQQSEKAACAMEENIWKLRIWLGVSSQSI